MGIGFVAFDKPTVVTTPTLLKYMKEKPILLAVENDPAPVVYDAGNGKWGVSLVSPDVIYELLLVGAKVRGRVQIKLPSATRPTEVFLSYDDRVADGIEITLSGSNINIVLVDSEKRLVLEGIAAKLLRRYIFETMKDTAELIIKTSAMASASWKPMNLERAMSVINGRSFAPGDIEYLEALASLVYYLVSGTPDRISVQNGEVYFRSLPLRELLKPFDEESRKELARPLLQEIATAIAEKYAYSEVVEFLRKHGVNATIVTEMDKQKIAIDWESIDISEEEIIDEIVNTGRVDGIKYVVLKEILSAYGMLILTINEMRRGKTLEDTVYQVKASAFHSDINYFALKRLVFLGNGCKEVDILTYECTAVNALKSVITWHNLDVDSINIMRHTPKYVESKAKVFAQIIAGNIDDAEKLYPVVRAIYRFLLSNRARVVKVKVVPAVATVLSKRRKFLENLYYDASVSETDRNVIGILKELSSALERELRIAEKLSDVRILA